jgi:RNA polymerase sigma factor (sigma-70 family)
MSRSELNQVFDVDLFSPDSGFIIEQGVALEDFETEGISEEGCREAEDQSMISKIDENSIELGENLTVKERGDLIRIFLEEIQRYPLLTAEEERMWGKIIGETQIKILATFRETRLPFLNDLRKTVSEYLKYRKKGNFFPLSREQLVREIRGCLKKLVTENFDLMKTRQAGALLRLFRKIEQIYANQEFQRARDALINSNLRLVVRIAVRHQKAGRQLLDLIQDGNIGLMKAAEKFEHEKGFKFSTYASRWIVQAMASGIAKKNRQIHLPLHVMEDIAKVMSAVEDLERELGHSPDHKQIAVKTGLSLFDIERALECLKFSFPSIDAPPNNFSEEYLSELISDGKPSPYDRLAESYRAEKINDVLSNLANQRNSEILKLRFREFTLDEIGEVYKRTKERIRQIEKRTLNILKKPRYRELLEDL